MTPKTPERALTEADFKQRFRFGSGLRFDLFYSLEVLLDPAAQFHLEWKSQVHARLLDACGADLAYFHESPRFWIFVGDALGAAAPPDDIRGVLDLFGSLDSEHFRRALLEGALHDDGAAERIAKGSLSLEQALLQAPEPKREWLEHVELYPPALKSRTFLALTKVATEPGEAKDRVMRVLEAYWKTAFERTWTDLQPKLQRSRAEKERLLQSCTLEEFFRIAVLRLETDGDARCLRALRGGYALPWADVREAWVLPSVFNRHRYWTAFEEKGGTVVFLPYFDAAIAVDSEAASAGAPEPDPALIFKALGDTTRFAIVRLLANRATTSADLADQLALSRPTISHHVVVLREAGLLREASAAGSIVLHLRREPLRDLSEAVLRRLAADGPEGAAETRPIKTSRRRPRK